MTILWRVWLSQTALVAVMRNNARKRMIIMMLLFLRRALNNCWIPNKNMFILIYEMW
jgi:hypothetical protein